MQRLIGIDAPVTYSTYADVITGALDSISYLIVQTAIAVAVAYSVECQGCQSGNMGRSHGGATHASIFVGGCRHRREDTKAWGSHIDPIAIGGKAG